MACSASWPSCHGVQWGVTGSMCFLRICKFDTCHILHLDFSLQSLPCPPGLSSPPVLKHFWEGERFWSVFLSPHYGMQYLGRLLSWISASHGHPIMGVCPVHGIWYDAKCVELLNIMPSHRQWPGKWHTSPHFHWSPSNYHAFSARDSHVFLFLPHLKLWHNGIENAGFIEREWNSNFKSLFLT